MKYLKRIFKNLDLAFCILFILLTFGTSWFAYMVFDVPYDLLMFAPMSVSCGLTIMQRRKLKLLFKIGSIWNICLGFFISVLAGFIFLFLAIFFSLGEFGLSEEAIQYNNGSQLQAWLRFMIFGVPYMLSINFIFAIGEEIGWRGFLLNQLKNNISNFWIRSSFVGIIWGIWHLPIYINENLPALKIMVFLVNVCLISVLYTWLYEKQHSVWPTAIAHAAHNMIFNSIVPSVTLTEFSYPYILWGEEGLFVTSSYLLIIFFIFFCFGQYKYRGTSI